MLAETLRWPAEHQRVLLDAALRHLELSLAALAVAVVVALPLGIALTRAPGAAGFVTGIANVLRTIPSLALLVLMLPLLGTGYLPAMVALTVYGVPAILLNTYAGVLSVDADIVDAARGMGTLDFPELLVGALAVAALAAATELLFAGLERGIAGRRAS